MTKLPPGAVERLRRIRLVVSDMDGTLLNAKNELPEITRRLIDRLEQLNVSFALGTGRPRVSAARPFSEEFGFHTRPGIFLNGAQVHGTQGETVSETVITAEAVHAAMDALALHRPHRLTVVLCAGDKTHLVASEDDNAFSYYLAAKYNDPVPTMLPEQEGVAVNMITVLCRDKADVKTWLIPELQQVADLHDLVLVNSLPNLVSLLPPRTSKAEGVRVLAEKLGVSLEEVAAVGDAHNDLDMLKAAGLAVAVGNATADLKAVAHVVVNHHDHEHLPGVAQLLQMIIDANTEVSPRLSS